MADTKTYIELNGKHYDPQTGEMVTGTERDHRPRRFRPHRRSGQKHQASMDAVLASPKAANLTTESVDQKPSAHKPNRAPHHVAHHTPQKTRTLVRKAVSKPAGSVSRAVLPIDSLSAEATIKPLDTDLPQADRRRVLRAKRVGKSHMISRFGNPLAPSLVQKVEPIAVRPAPKPEPAPPQPPPLLKQPSHRGRPTHQKRHQDHLEAALARADSHQHKPLKRPRAHHRVAKKLGVKTKTLSLAASVLAFLLLSGFIAYQNSANLAVRVAASRAGLAAHMPGYYPSGFSYAKPIYYKPGQITINFRSNSDDRSFNITQTTSNWNSETLRDNHVAVNQQDYQTFEQKGKTIYVYGANATWVDGGVWYTVESNDSLSSEQLIKIANSM